MKQARALDLTVLLLASVVVAVLAAGCDSDAERQTATPTMPGTSEATLTPTATVAPSATAVPPGPPYLERFAAGETIDVAPAVVFVDPETGVAEAWVIPDMRSPKFAAAPDGSYVVYEARNGGLRLLRTDDGVAHDLGADSLPRELGPGGAGFIATSQDHFVVSAFDGRGEHLGELWLGGVSGRTAVAWAEDGELIAHALYPGGGSALTVTLTSVDGWTARPVDVGQSSGGVSLEWSRDSERLAVVTDDHVRVLDRDGRVLGTYQGQFGGAYANPRWSSDDGFLYVGWMPPVGGGEVASLFSPDAEPLFRFVTPDYAGGCGGEVWFDAGSLQFGEHDVRVDGALVPRSGERRDIWSAERLGVVLAEGVSFHLAEYGERGGYGELGDGRLVFATFRSVGGTEGVRRRGPASRKTNRTSSGRPIAPDPNRRRSGERG